MNNSKRILNKKGFSLLEILIAITLIAIFMGTVGSDLFSNLEEGKVENAKIQMKNIEGMLGQFRRHCNRYPTTEQGLKALIEKPSGGRECKKYAPNGYMKSDEVPMDPWDGEYVYESTGRAFTITSAGADEELGSEDDVVHKGR